MKHTEQYIEKMYSYAKKLYDWEDIYDIYELRRLYTDIAEEFNLDIAFWIDWNEDWWDDEIYCYIHVNWIWSIVFDWSCNNYTDWNLYKDTVNYILELEEEWERVKEKVLNPNQK